jgi:hypothetical protein
MPINSSTEILRRWMVMDKVLAGNRGLHVPTFAEEWEVSERQVKRDLAAFRALGQEIELEYVGRKTDVREYHHHYVRKKDVRPLFVQNLRDRDIREMVRERDLWETVREWVREWEEKG